MYADVVFHEDPHWSQRPGRRLALNFLPATIIVLGVLASLRMPLIEQSLPMTELIVRILVDEVAQVVESPPVEQPIREHVERDTMGRALLRSGDCYRVIDDPNVGSRDAFLTFGQFMVFCDKFAGTPEELAFVKEIQNRRAGQARYGHPVVE